MSQELGAAPREGNNRLERERLPAQGLESPAPSTDPLDSAVLPAVTSPPDNSLPLHAAFPPAVILGLKDDPAKMVELSPAQVLSKDTGSFGKLVQLHAAIDRTMTRLGSAALLRDILNPPNTIEQVLLRRQAIEELRENESLRTDLRTALRKARLTNYHGFDCEEVALRFFVPDKADRWAETASIPARIKEYVLEWLNTDRKKTIELKAFGTLLDPFTEIGGGKSPLINELLSAVRTVRSSPESPLLDGEVRCTLTGIHPKGELPWYLPRIPMTAGFFNRDIPLLGLAAVIGETGASKVFVVAPKEFNPGEVVFWGFGVYLIARSFLVGEQMLPELRARISRIEGLFGALDAVGELDALLTLAELPETFGARGSWPRFVEAERYSLRAHEMHHPVLLTEAGSVSNDVNLRGGAANVLTGPNSGGKTTAVTAILQNQILAQLGTVVAAREMTVTVADQILFQGPSYAALGDHGRFGTELLATKAIFERATAHSLVILDEVGDGTTAEERTEMAHAIVGGFNSVGAGLWLVTHNVALAKRLVAEGMAESHQMEFRDGQPTYRVVPGLSTASHAEAVAASIGFSRKDIEALVQMKTRGSLPQSGDLG